MIRYEDVQDQTTESYFHGNQFSIDAFNKKYVLTDDETFVRALWRVCVAVASVEATEELRDYWARRWFDEIYNDWWKPAGSIWQGAGSGKKISLANCTTVLLGNVDPDNEWDNLESIIKNGAFNVAKMAAHRQGLGLDFSRLRPRGTSVNNSAKESTGAIHWMRFIDSIGYFVGQKGRIPAMLFSINISHPDVEEFITVKSDHTKIQNANISVQVTDDFYAAVEADAMWTLKFEIPERKKGDRVYIDYRSADGKTLRDDRGWYYVSKHNTPREVIKKEVRARDLLDLIAKQMWANAEPGIQNIDLMRKWGNADYVFDPDGLSTTCCSSNACSEQALSDSSLCILASLNLGRFSTDPKQYIAEVAGVAQSMQRFLDNVNEYELVNHTYATDTQADAIRKLRRIGAGMTNIAGWLFKHGLPYGSETANSRVSDFMERFNYYLYKSSIEVGKEKGSFALFERERFERSPFVQHMMDLGLVFETMRNVTCSSIAPTGSLSLLFREMVMSYGIEPPFGVAFWKRTRIAGKYDYYFCVPRIVRDLLADHGYKVPMDSDTIMDTWDGKKGKPIAEFIHEALDKLGIKVTVDKDVKIMDKLDLMARIMKNCDSSISVTYGLPEDSTWQDVRDFILETRKRGVKSVAAFPLREMYGIVSDMAFQDLAVYLKEKGIEMHPQNFSPEELEFLGLAFKNRAADAVKRPKSLPCDIYHIKCKGEPYFVVVGMYDGTPYEVFVGKDDGACTNKSVEHGTIIKVKRGHYRVVSNDEVVIENVSAHCNHEEGALTRLTSLSLRHNVPVDFVVHPLEKSEGDLYSLSRGLVRVLKKYIQDGTRVSGAACPACNSAELVRQEGCISCGCGWSKCT